jgi:hypothetical protein
MSGQKTTGGNKMTNPAPYATNTFGVSSRPIDYTAGNGSPTMQTYHGGTIVVNNAIVGRIDSWASAGAYSRGVELVYEVNKNTWGLPVDAVPGISTGFNVTWTRGEVWEQELEIAIGYKTGVWNSLNDQNRPFAANEMLFKGATAYRNWLYSGCWFTGKNANGMESTGNGRIIVSCDMMYVTRKRVL